MEALLQKTGSLSEQQRTIGDLAIPLPRTSTRPRKWRPRSHTASCATQCSQQHCCCGQDWKPPRGLQLPGEEENVSTRQNSSGREKEQSHQTGHSTGDPEKEAGSQGHVSGSICMKRGQQAHHRHREQPLSVRGQREGRMGSDCYQCVASSGDDGNAPELSSGDDGCATPRIH